MKIEIKYTGDTDNFDDKEELLRLQKAKEMALALYRIKELIINECKKEARGDATETYNTISLIFINIMHDLNLEIDELIS